MAFWEQGLEEIFHDDKAHSPSMTQVGGDEEMHRTWDFSQRASCNYIQWIVEQVSKGNTEHIRGTQSPV